MSMQSSAAKNEDYFSNHGAVTKWPFTLYHHPIEQHLAAELCALKRLSSDPAKPPRIMVFGCGLFHEIEFYPPSCILTLVDCDPRVFAQIEPAIKSYFTSVETICARSVDELHKQSSHKQFDFIAAKEVIEHITDAGPYLTLFRNVLAEGGTFWLSTPNYGDFILPFLECTALEAIARAQGFSRHGIHPNKYSADRLRAALTVAGFSRSYVKKTRWKLALAATAVK